MAIKLVETAIRPTTIRLRYADADDPAAATEWIDLHFAAKDLKNPKSGNPLGNLEPRYLLEIQAAALHHARDIMEAEIQRLNEVMRSEPPDG